MTSAFILVRRQGVLDHDLQAGEYLQRPKAAPACVALRCPGCSGLGQLLRTTHSVDALTGTVSPTVICPACNFTGLIVLADWVPEARGSA